MPAGPKNLAADAPWLGRGSGHGAAAAKVSVGVITIQNADPPCLESRRGGSRLNLCLLFPFIVATIKRCVRIHQNITCGYFPFHLIDEERKMSPLRIPGPIRNASQSLLDRVKTVLRPPKVVAHTADSIGAVLPPNLSAAIESLNAGPIHDITLPLVHQAEVAFKRVAGLKAFPGPDHPLDVVPDDLGAIDLAQRVPDGALNLLLVHGITDRLHGAAFLHLLRNSRYRRLFERYDGRVFGFDHYTLSESPLDNARALAELLPHNQALDIICHSRGGLVTRCLLEHPTVRPVLDAKGVTLRRVVFVGAANQGSPLATRQNLKLLLSLMHDAHAQAAREGGWEQGYLEKATALLGVVAALVAAQIVALPGVDALVPDSGLIRELNAAPAVPMPPTFFVRANFGNSKGPLSLLEKTVKDVFRTEPNDLVVPFRGMNDLRGRTPAPIIEKVLDHVETPQGRDWHLTYFASEPVLDFILQQLTPD
jgi:hypothetical protein